MRYDFTYRDLTDGYDDEYQSNNHKSLSEAREAWSIIRNNYGGEVRIIETWIHDDDGEYVGRWL